MPTEPLFARVDFAASGPLWFAEFDAIIRTHHLAEIPACLAQLEQAVANGQHAVGFIGYEAAPAFDAALTTQPPNPHLPLLWFGLSANPVSAPPLTPIGDYAFSDWQPQLTRAEYAQQFDSLHRHIAAGNTYQVNFTFPLHAKFSGNRAALYAQLCQAQSADYCAWIHTPEWDVMTASPELFFTWQAGTLTTRPMKGTHRRGRTTAEDAAFAEALRQSEKERAENVMIVDLLRNDLGRIAQTGSVQVTNLFALERYPTVWQMTSTITAQPRPQVGLTDILRALFPCGSVTGAPKVRTMRLIAEHEVAARGIYCGSVGYLAPDGSATFNVAIRTLTLTAAGQAQYAVGSGLVADSQADAEYDECLLKAKILQPSAHPQFDLLESLAFYPTRGYLLLERHLARLADSAAFFGYPCDTAAVQAQMQQASTLWLEPQKVRVCLSASGGLTITAAALTPPGWQLTRTATLAPRPVDPADRFLYHKTTHRSVYAQAANGHAPADTVLFYNPLGQLTESQTANLALEIDGQWLTPPVACGLLPGTLRAELLASGQLAEQIVTLDDLKRATRVQCFNSVRGRWDITLVT